MLGIRGFGFDIWCLHKKKSIFFNLVQKNSLIVEKFSKCRENGNDRLRKGNARR